jgi:hypothetical protein
MPLAPHPLPRTLSLAALLLTLLAGTAGAQSPSPAQRDAIRQACPRDYRAMCADVPAGGMASLQCLQRHMADLSPACGAAVGAVTPHAASAPGLPPATMAQEHPCRGDAMALCRGIRPGGGRELMCLREHAAELSPACRTMLEALRR